jgi:hypothetical protein
LPPTENVMGAAAASVENEKAAIQSPSLVRRDIGIPRGVEAWSREHQPCRREKV